MSVVYNPEQNDLMAIASSKSTAMAIGFTGALTWGMMKFSGERNTNFLMGLIVGIILAIVVALIVGWIYDAIPGFGIWLSIILLIIWIIIVYKWEQIAAAVKSNLRTI